MYMSRMLEVGKCENGYVVSCSVPIKKDSKKSAKMMDCCTSSSCDKEYIAKDEKEVAALIQDLMPLLDADYASEDEFDAAYDKAVGEPEEKD